MARLGANGSATPRTRGRIDHRVGGAPTVIVWFVLGTLIAL